ncbi:MAG: hypothetical protein ACW99G_11345 [Candidatus Thorarchaeota archaeon]|jgi:hypothetical protein
MIEKRGDALEHLDECDLLVIPACSTLRNGVLDMDRGICKDVTNIWKGIDRYFGKHIDRVCGNNGEFWFARHPSLPIGLLQIRTRANFNAMPDVATEGLFIIRRIAEAYTDMNIILILPNGAINSNAQMELDAMPDNVVRYK